MNMVLPMKLRTTREDLAKSESLQKTDRKLITSRMSLFNLLSAQPPFLFTIRFTRMNNFNDIKNVILRFSLSFRLALYYSHNLRYT